ncbi:hypothetical protein ACI7RC_10275 [Brevibacillus sp. B_LB10_24]|uniref:hypothetical protein n=1 Tax=Brevibacillus sp. B_LB10_24 TaxID=3380645 RepID=UPI0038BA8EB6
MYTAHVAGEFRQFTYDYSWVEGLHYFDAYASLCEASAALCKNGDVYGIASRLKRFAEKDNFDKLSYKDARYIADFLDSLLTDSPPTSDEVFKFLGYIVELSK